MNNRKILMADDEPKILKVISDVLGKEGFQAFTAINGQDVLAKLKLHKPDLIILDVMMPDMDGFEVCREIRKESNVPVIFLSAKTEISDKITGLAIGCDDYITKPFDRAELVLRIKAVLRRYIDGINATGENNLITIPGMSIDWAARIVEVGGTEIELTCKEFELLRLLAGHPNQVFTRDQLIYQIWDTEYWEDSGIVTTLVKRLREKIEPDPANPVFVKTIRGIGYKFGVKPC